MKKLFLFLILTLQVPYLFAQNSTVLRGWVKLQNSGSKPLADVKITALGSGTVYSNSNGIFELTFSNKKAGTPVSLIIQKEGYDLVNDKEIENCVLREDPDDLVVIVMAERGTRDQQAVLYYNIIVENLNTGYNSEVAALREEIKGLKEDDEKRSILYKQLDVLQKEKELLTAKAEDLAKQLSAVDLDDVSGLAKEAYAVFKKGEIKKAIEILDDKTLAGNLKSAEEQKQKTDSIWQQSIDNYMIKARFCRSDRQYKAAYRNYLKAIEADTANVENLWELAYYCSNLNQQRKAIIYYQKALNCSINESQKAVLLNNLGIQWNHNNNYAESKMAYREALLIFRRFAKTNPKEYDPDVATILNNLGLLYDNLNNYPSAETAYKEALSIRKRFAKINPDRYDPDVATTLNNLGMLYDDLNNYPSAETAYKEALSIRKRFAKINPDCYDPDVASTLNNLGLMYLDLNNYVEAETACKEALAIRKRLAKLNPERFDPSVAKTLGCLGIIYKNLYNFPSSEMAYKEALSIYRRLAKMNPDRYDPDFAGTQNNLGLLYNDLNNYSETEAAYKDALSIYRRLAQRNPDRYDMNIASILNNLGLMYDNLNKYSESEMAYKEALAIFEYLTKTNPELCDLSIASTQNNLGNLYNDFGKYIQAETAYKEALSIFLRLAQTNPERFDPSVAVTQNNLGLTYTILNNYAESETAYKEALLIRKRLAKGNPEKFSIDLCKTLLSMALFKKEQLEKTLHIKYREEGQLLIAETQQILAAYNSDIPMVKTIKEKKEYLAAYFETITEENLKVQAQINKVISFEEENKKTKDPVKKVANLIKVVELLLDLQAQYPTNDSVDKRLANTLGTLAWYYLFTQQFDLAEQAARNGMKEDISAEWINTNLALSLLYQGKYEEASTLYFELKDKPFRGGIFKEVFLEDLTALEKAGITHTDVEKIRQLLK